MGAWKVNCLSLTVDRLRQGMRGMWCGGNRSKKESVTGFRGVRGPVGLLFRILCCGHLVPFWNERFSFQTCRCVCVYSSEGRKEGCAPPFEVSWPQLGGGALLFPLGALNFSSHRRSSTGDAFLLQWGHVLNTEETKMSQLTRISALALDTCFLKI